jgi:hypothetical protein
LNHTAWNGEYKVVGAGFCQEESSSVFSKQGNKFSVSIKLLMSKFNFCLGQYNLCLLEDEGRKEERKIPKGRFTLYRV